MVTTKLLEMQAAKEAERQRRKELRMAERLAVMSTDKGPNVLVDQQKVATGRILEQVEQQEMASEELKVGDNYIIYPELGRTKGREA